MRLFFLGGGEVGVAGLVFLDPVVVDLDVLNEIFVNRELDL